MMCQIGWLRLTTSVPHHGVMWARGTVQDYRQKHCTTLILTWLPTMLRIIKTAALFHHVASFTTRRASSSSSWSHTMMSASAGSLEIAQFPCLSDNYG